MSGRRTDGSGVTAQAGRRSAICSRSWSGTWATLSRDVSADWRFGIAYNAALKLCAVLLHAEGYRPERTLQHYRTIQAVGLILPDWDPSDTTYLDTCRQKRNTAEYDLAGSVTTAEADELVSFTENLRARVLIWLRNNHPELLGSGV